MSADPCLFNFHTMELRHNAFLSSDLCFFPLEVFTKCFLSCIRWFLVVKLLSRCQSLLKFTMAASKSLGRMASHVILDLDGTLINTGEVWRFLYLNISRSLSCLPAHFFTVDFYSHDLWFIITDGIVNEVLSTVLVKYGKKWDKKVAQRIIGKTPMEAVAAVVEDYELPCKIEEFVSTITPMFNERYFPLQSLMLRIVLFLLVSGWFCFTCIQLSYPMLDIYDYIHFWTHISAIVNSEPMHAKTSTGKEEWTIL